MGEDNVTIFHVPMCLEPCGGPKGRILLRIDAVRRRDEHRRSALRSAERNHFLLELTFIAARGKKHVQRHHL